MRGEKGPRTATNNEAESLRDTVSSVDPRIKEIEDKLSLPIEEGRDTIFEHEIYEILNLVGFRTPLTAFAADEAEAGGTDLSRFPGGRVVCKIISPGMVHRFEHGGVRFVEKSGEALVKTFRDFKRTADEAGIPLSGMLVAEEIECRDSVPYQLLLSFRQDPSMGPVVFMGLGGVGTEVYKKALKEKKAILIRSAYDMGDDEGTGPALDKTLFYPVIAGRTRISHRPLVEPSTLRDALGAFAFLAERFSHTSGASHLTIEELEVNPLQITANGVLVPLDAMMRVSKIKSRPLYPNQAGIRSLLEPESALIIGASASKPNVGRIILGNLVKGGRILRERIYLLHPEASEIDGCRSFRSIGELPEKVDMAVFAIPATERAAELLEDIIEEEKAGSITLISGGFGETESGKVLDWRLQEAIRRGRETNERGVVVNGPNCLGIVSKPGGYNTFFLPEYKLPFRGRYGEKSAFISQSGAYLVTLVSNLAELVSPKYMITYGNQIDLTVTDYLIYLKDDPEIELFTLYVEGLKPYDGERFLKVAKEIIAAGKNIIMFKTGRTEAGAAAVASHTASMAGDYEVLHRVLTDAGVIMPETLNEAEDAIKVFSLLADKKVKGKRVGIYSNTGFECSVASDRLYSMELARFSDETFKKLHEVLPTEIIDIRNPVDATPLTDAVNYGKCLQAMIDDPGVDCLVAANVAPTPFMENLPRGDDHEEDILREDSYPNITKKVFRRTDKPMVVSLNSGKLYDPAMKMMEQGGIPCFRKIDRAMKALDLFLKHRKAASDD